MSTELKRFTISVTPEMEIALDAAKKERYYKATQSQMIRDLITRGLNALQVKREIHTSERDRSA